MLLLDETRGEGSLPRPSRDLSGLVAHDRALERPGHWRKELAGNPDQAWISGQRILLTTTTLDYHAWGHLGPALLLDLATGETVAELRGQSGAPLPGERFLLGLEGYDSFDTWLYDRDGKLLQEWRSFGHYVVENDDVRIVECDRRRPTSSRIQRLRLDGGLEPGPPLTEGQISPPVLRPDGTLLVLDCGVLRAIDRELKESFRRELLRIPEGESWRFWAQLELSGDELSVSLQERSAEPPLEYRWYRWRLSFSSEG